MTKAPERERSTAEVRRREVLAAAVTVFAHQGYHATTVADVAEEAGISHGYVLRLFGTKLALFVAAVEETYARIDQTLRDAVPEDGSDAMSSEQALDAMGRAYAGLIKDRDLLMLQVHAQSASSVPEIRAAVRDGLKLVVGTAQGLSGGTDDQVQRFIAYGQLCHVVLTADLPGRSAHWARVLDHGIRH